MISFITITLEASIIVVVAVIMISILQMRKLRLKDVQLLAESYTFCNKSRSIFLRAHALGHIFAPYENLV